MKRKTTTMAKKKIDKKLRKNPAHAFPIHAVLPGLAMFAVQGVLSGATFEETMQVAGMIPTFLAAIRSRTKGSKEPQSPST